MYLYERIKVISRETSYERSFFTSRRIRKRSKYAKNVLPEGLNLKGLILFASIYQIGDAAYPLIVLENIVLVLKMLN